MNAGRGLPAGGRAATGVAAHPLLIVGEADWRSICDQHRFYVMTFSSIHFE